MQKNYYIQREDVYSKKPWIRNYDKEVPPQLTYEDKTFAEMFAETVKKYPDNINYLSGN